MDQLISYGQMVCNKLVGAWGEWKGFEVPEIKYNINQLLIYKLKN